MTTGRGLVLGMSLPYSKEHGRGGLGLELARVGGLAGPVNFAILPRK